MSFWPSWSNKPKTQMPKQRSPQESLWSKPQTEMPKQKSPQESLTKLQKQQMNRLLRIENIMTRVLLVSNQMNHSQQEDFGKQIKNFPLFNDIKEFQGLPNIGNTCFINSFMQMLFSCKKFRLLTLLYSHQLENIIPKSSKNNKKPILIIQELFWTMLAPREKIYQLRPKKYKILEKVVSVFESQQSSETPSSYTRYSQQDSFMYLMNFITLLKKDDPQISNIFQFSYMKICINQSQHKHHQFITLRNGKKKIIIEKFEDQYILDMPFDNCGEDSCMKGHDLKQNQFVFLDGSPDGLLMAKNQYIQSARYPNSLWYFELKNIDYMSSSHFPILYLINYKLKSKLLYSGNGQCGHYIAMRKTIQENICKDSHEFYVFNDSQMSKSQYYHSYRSLKQTAFLYEKTNLIELDCKKIIQKVQVWLKNIQNNKPKSNQLKNWKVKMQSSIKEKLSSLFEKILNVNKEILGKIMDQEEFTSLKEKFFHLIMWIINRQKLTQNLNRQSSEQHHTKSRNPNVLDFEDKEESQKMEQRFSQRRLDISPINKSLDQQKNKSPKNSEKLTSNHENYKAYEKHSQNYQQKKYQNNIQCCDFLTKQQKIVHGNKNISGVTSQILTFLISNANTNPKIQLKETQNFSNENQQKNINSQKENADVPQFDKQTKTENVQVSPHVAQTKPQNVQVSRHEGRTNQIIRQSTNQLQVNVIKRQNQRLKKDNSSKNQSSCIKSCIYYIFDCIFQESDNKIQFQQQKKNISKRKQF